MGEQHRKEMEAKKDASKRERRGLGTRSETMTEDHDDENTPRINIPPPPRIEDEELPEIPETEVPMYFTQPQQLMDIFAALEEQNLFLIQNSQETEHTLEELRLAFRETRETMNSQTALLQSQIDDLQYQIQLEERRAKDLLAKRMAAADISSSKDKSGTVNLSLTGTQNGGVNQSQLEKEKLLGDLHNKVKVVYEQCGFDASSKPSTLFMLSQLESKLEVLLVDIEKMPVDYVIKSEKEKEKKRRERKREEQQALQEKLQEERNKRSIERSLQAPKKRMGRQVMYRSKPIRKEKINHGDDTMNKDNNDELKFLS